MQFRVKTPASHIIEATQITGDTIANSSYPVELLPYLRELYTPIGEKDSSAVLLLDGDDEPSLVFSGDYVVPNTENEGLYRAYRQVDFEAEFEPV